MTGQPTQVQAEAIASALGEGGLFIADRDGELLASDLETWTAARRLLATRPCAVFGCWRRGGLLAQDPLALPPVLRAERQADARLYGWNPQRVGEPSAAERADCCARLQDRVEAACARPGLERLWLWCAYRERGCPLAIEPAVVVAGAIDAAWVLAVAGACNQQHIMWASADRGLRPHLAERDETGSISGYRPIAGSPPRLRLLIGSRREA